MDIVLRVLRFLSGLLLGWCSVCWAAPPNVVIVLADDLGWNDVGYHGSEISTPRLDALAGAGVVLQQFHAQPTCSPTRAALMTGKSPMRLGVYRQFAKNSVAGLPLQELTLADRFKQAGYQTFMTGKWHLGHASRAYQPNARGFDHFYGHVTGGIGYWDHVHGGGLDWQRNGSTVREEGYSTRLLADEAVRLIKDRDAQRPFLLYASFNAPHLPNEAPEETVARFQDLENPYRQMHAAMVWELDAAIGRLVDVLQAEGVLDNTLIWFMSDNGGLNPQAGFDGLRDLSQRLQDWFGKPLPVTMLEFIRVNTLEGGASNEPLRYGKGSVYEGGARVPSLVYWRGRLAAAEVAQMITVQDVLPTLLSAAGLQTSKGFDGADQWPAIQGDAAVEVPDYVTVGQGGEEAFYRWPWKLISGGEAPELYDLSNDPTERHNLAAGRPEVVQTLRRALADAPRGENVHIATYKVFLDPDFFGGEEDRPPWADVTR